MKLVILGAGASFDSVYDFFDEKSIMPWRPPLANELFDTRREFRNIIQNYPGGDFYLSQLNAIDDIEEYFQSQWHFLKNNRAVDLAASFLNLNYCLSSLMYQVSNNYKNVGLSNYDILIKKAYEYAISKKEDVMFVSFNYDTLLENSLNKLYFGDGRKFDIADYIKFPVKIIKPHGSCNWVKRFDRKFAVPGSLSVSRYLFQSKTSLREITQNLEDEILCVENPVVEKYFGEINQIWNCFPQILIPLKDKDDFILPKTHLEYLQNNIDKTSEILIIGWKGTEAKFQHLLKTSISSKPVEVISINAENHDIENVLSKYLPGAKFYHYGEPSSFMKYDNRKVLESMPANTKEIRQGPGTFSSYTINTQKGNFVDFFKL